MEARRAVLGRAGGGGAPPAAGFIGEVAASTVKAPAPAQTGSLAALWPPCPTVLVRAHPSRSKKAVRGGVQGSTASRMRPTSSRHTRRTVRRTAEPTIRTSCARPTPRPRPFGCRTPRARCRTPMSYRTAAPRRNGPAPWPRPAGAALGPARPPARRPARPRRRGSRPAAPPQSGGRRKTFGITEPHAGQTSIITDSCGAPAWKFAATGSTCR